MNSLRVIAPLVLFVAFAAAHRMAVMSRPGVQLVKATRDLEAGHALEGRDVEMVMVTTAGRDDLTKTFVPFTEHGTELLYNRINRKIRAGELIAFLDLQQPEDRAPILEPGEVGVHVAMDQLTFAKGQLHVGISVGFLLETTPGEDPELLQPFKIVGIGDRVSETTVTEGSTQRGDSRVLTIAVEKAKDQDDETRLSQKANRLIRAASSDPNRPERIRALVILPSSKLLRGVSANSK